MVLLHNVDRWITENSKFFLPPVCNKLMHKDGQLKVMFVGGPNVRRDYHIEEGEEIFYQVKGDMCLKIMERAAPKDVLIREGEIFLLPARIPHSPQRFANTVGLVLERLRHPESAGGIRSEIDCLRYYTQDNSEILWEKWFYCEDLGVDLPPVINEYRASEQFKTGKPVPGFVKRSLFPLDVTTTVQEPFSLKRWTDQHRAKIDHGPVAIFDNGWQTKVWALGQGVHSLQSTHYETFIWQQEGRALLNIDGEEHSLEAADSYLVKEKQSYTLTEENRGFAITIHMDSTLKPKYW